MNESTSSGDTHFAAIDLGSNSFHMVIATPDGDSIRIIDKLRVPIRLGAGLDKHKNITKETHERAMETFSQFAQRLRDVPRKNIRIVGTNTLRRAKNSEGFMREATHHFGKRIEIISGREEARLIYSAVAHSLPDASRQRLVIDIGGGSTELVIGTGYKPALMESINIGCVSYATRFFGGKKSLDADIVKVAQLEAELELRPLAKQYREMGWSEVIGCSGTMKAASRMLAELGITDGTITRDGLRQLFKQIIKAGSVDAMKLTQISQSRAMVIMGGLVVLRAVLRTMNVDTVHASQVALREGLIFDMIGKVEHTDIQSETLNNLAERFLIDEHQARRVVNTAVKLFQHVSETWGLDTENDLELLTWAAKLHELGMGVAHTQYHKHGAYIIENSDLLGFNLAEQSALALLVRYHRRKIDQEAFASLPDTERERLLRLLSLLRLAALFHRGRHAETLDEIDIKIKEGQITVIAPRDWLEDNPLTYAELQAEAERLLHVNIKLKAEKTKA